MVERQREGKKRGKGEIKRKNSGLMCSFTDFHGVMET
jgi:hypothetical protein